MIRSMTNVFQDRSSHSVIEEMSRNPVLLIRLRKWNLLPLIGSLTSANAFIRLHELAYHSYGHGERRIILIGFENREVFYLQELDMMRF